MNYYRRYSGDYLRDTARLSVTEHGAYCLLLDYYYCDEKPLPLDKEELYLMVRAMKPSDRQAVDKVLSLYFKAEADGYHNTRADIEIGVASKVIETAKENGKKGGRPPKTNLDETKTETQTITKTGTETITQTITRDQSKTEPANNHPPTTNHQPPASTPQPPAVSLQPPKVKPVSDPPQKTRRSEPGETVPVWTAYANRYQQRYGAEPTRNAKINGMLARFLERVPTEEAPAIAEFFVGHNGQFYVRKMHCIDLLLQDAEKLRTEWITGRKMTGLEAKSAEQTDAVAEQIKRVGERLQA